MVELSMVTTRLQLMQQQLHPMMNAFFQGAPEDVEERNRRLAELERMGENVRIIVRDIRSEQNRLEVAQRNMGGLPRDNRWSANQSLNQRQQDLQNAVMQAQGLAESIRQLMDKNGFLSKPQMAMKLMDLIENMEKSAEQGQAIHQIISELGGPAITQAPAEHASVSTLVPVLVFVIYGIRRITGKNRGSSSAAGN
jgi:hypothetical protein